MCYVLVKHVTSWEICNYENGILRTGFCLHERHCPIFDERSEENLEKSFKCYCIFNPDVILIEYFKLVYLSMCKILLNKKLNKTKNYKFFFFFLIHVSNFWNHHAVIPKKARICMHANKKFQQLQLLLKQLKFHSITFGIRHAIFETLLPNESVCICYMILCFDRFSANVCAKTEII